MTPTVNQLLEISPGADTDAIRSNCASIVAGLSRFGAADGLDQPHRLAHYLAQLGEESGGFKWDKELASGAEYEGRKNLGNTQPGDGVRFKGRTPLQITGRANYRAFTAWARKADPAAPDFEAAPELLNTDPWEGLGPMWFWTTHGLNALADENNIEQITKRINGGLNGFDVRLKYYTRAALVLLGYGADDVRAFQRKALADGLIVKRAGQSDTDVIDGDAGPRTRGALHMALADLATPKDAPPPVTVKPSPVVDEKTVEVPVIPKGSDKPGAARWLASLPLIATPLSFFGGLDNTGKLIVAGLAIGGVLAMLFLGERIAMRAKAVIKSFES